MMQNWRMNKAFKSSILHLHFLIAQIAGEWVSFCEYVIIGWGNGLMLLMSLVITRTTDD